MNKYERLAPEAALSDLRALTARENIPLLGDIMFALHRDRAAARRCGVPMSLVSEEYDRAFLETRPDYRLNRLRSLKWIEQPWMAPGDVLGLIERSLEQPGGAVLWGVLTVAAVLLSRPRLSKPLGEAHFAGLAYVTEMRLRRMLPPLSGSERGCAAIEALARCGARKVLLPAVGTRRGDPPGAIEFLSQIAGLLMRLDPTWKPGKALSMQHLGGDSRRLVPFDKVQLSERLHQVLHFAAFLASAEARQCEFDDSMRTLMDLQFRFRHSHWRNIRSLRLAEERRLSERPGYRPRWNPAWLFGQEIQILDMTAFAARDAGDYLAAARLTQILMRLLPDDLSENKAYGPIAQRLSYRTDRLLEAGFEVEPRFASELADNQLSGDEPKPWAASVDPQSAIDLPPGIRRILTDSECDPRWRDVLKRFPVPPGTSLLDHLRDIARTAEARLLAGATANSLRNAYGLCLKYACLRSAVSLAHAFHPTIEEVLDLAHTMKRVVQAAPLAVDPDVHAEWQAALRDLCARRPIERECADNDQLTLHEVLCGRSLAIRASTNVDAAHRLSRKWYGVASDEEIRESWSEIGAHRGPATVDTARIGAMLESAGSAGLGAPVALSAVALDEAGRVWSAIAINRAGQSVRGRFETPTDVISDARSLLESPPELHLTSIPWSTGFRKVALRLVQLAEELDPAFRWVVLNVDARAAAVPWQDLILKTRDGRPETLVSLVPSLTWASLISRRLEAAHGAAEVRVSDDLDLKDLAATIQRPGDMDRMRSALVVCGHGEWVPNEQFTSVRIGDAPPSIAEWIEMSARRLLVIHSCYSGRAGERCLGDLSGIPGLALGAGARLVVAPTLAVAPATAISLHRRLTSETSGRSVGEQYLAAVRDDPRVASYTLFGLAEEPGLFGGREVDSA